MDKEGLIAIESKSGGRSETRSLKSFKEKYKPKITAILCKEKLLDDEGTLIMPFVFTLTLITV